MTHREPERDRPPLWARPGRSQPYEIIALLILVVVALSVGVHHRLARDAPPPAVEDGWPRR